MKSWNRNPSHADRRQEDGGGGESPQQVRMADEFGRCQADREQPGEYGCKQDDCRPETTFRGSDYETREGDSNNEVDHVVLERQSGGNGARQVSPRQGARKFTSAGKQHKEQSRSGME